MVQWNRVKACEDDADCGLFTFEVLLYESGDIVFLYDVMEYNDWGYCSWAGIENSTGLDGLFSGVFCGPYPAQRMIVHQRPPATARVFVPDPIRGKFTSAGAVETLPVTIQNYGDLGSDIYNVTVQSSWPATIHAANGALLADSDDDGQPDTGPVPQGESVAVLVKVQSPPIVNIGDTNKVQLTAASSRDPDQQAGVTLHTTVPAPFAQIYRDFAEPTMRLGRYVPAGATAAALKLLTDFAQYPALVKLQDEGYALFWDRYSCIQERCFTEIEYMLFDQDGATPRTGITKLTSNAGAAHSIYDDPPSIGVAPLGAIGVLWGRNELDNQFLQSRTRSNIYFAVVKPDGAVATRPFPLTNNTAFEPFGALNVERYYEPALAAAQDNRFFLTWETGILRSDGWEDNIFFSVRHAAGQLVKGITQLTNAEPDEWGYYAPSAIALRNNRALLIYRCEEGSCYAVVDSNGNQVAESMLAVSGRNHTGVQLAGGNIFLAWMQWADEKYKIGYGFLDGSTYAPIGQPLLFENPSTRDSEVTPSATADFAGNGIVTWPSSGSSGAPDLFYAAVRGDGSLLTPPQIFYHHALTPPDRYPNVVTSSTGQGNAPLTLQPPPDYVDTFVRGPRWAGARPGGLAPLSFVVGNQGGARATAPELTVVLDAALTFYSATPAPSAVEAAVTASGAGTRVTWNLPDLGYQGGGRVQIQVATPDGAIGAAYPVTATLTAAGEGNDRDNQATVAVELAHQLYLPGMQNQSRISIALLTQLRV